MSEVRLCSETIWQGMARYGCSKAAKVQSGGKWYCTVHSPEAVEKRKKKSAELYEAHHVKWRAQRDREKFNEQAGDVCRELGVTPAELRDENTRLRGIMEEAASAPGKDWLEWQLKLGAALTPQGKGQQVLKSGQSQEISSYAEGKGGGNDSSVIVMGPNDALTEGKGGGNG
jgi:hypothetical protein